MSLKNYKRVMSIFVSVGIGIGIASRESVFDSEGDSEKAILSLAGSTQTSLCGMRTPNRKCASLQGERRRDRRTETG